MQHLQDAMSSSGSYADGPTSPTRRPTGRSSSPSWLGPDKRSPDRRSRLQHSSSAHAGFDGSDASPAGSSSPSPRALSPSKLFQRALPFPTNITSSASTNRISDGANDSSTNEDNDPVPQQPLRDMLAASMTASKQQKQQHPKSLSTALPSSPRASPSPSAHMRGSFAPSPTTSPARAAAPAALPGFVPASPARAQPLLAELQDNILQLVSLLSCTDSSISAQAAEQLAVLAFSDEANSGPIVAAGAVEPLARMLRGAASDEQQQGAAAALWGLARGSSAHQAIIIDNSAVPRWVCLQEWGGVQAMQRAWHVELQQQCFFVFWASCSVHGFKMHCLPHGIQRCRLDIALQRTLYMLLNGMAYSRIVYTIIKWRSTLQQQRHVLWHVMHAAFFSAG
jgi:hypothetical protein